jgi:F-type H+-transporting ATPase subunit delta
MAEVSTIARPYAEAVFGLADTANALPEWSQALAIMAEVAAHPEVKACIDNPNLSAAQLYGLFVSICREQLSVSAQNLVRVLIENDRLALLPQIRGAFEALKNERDGVVEAEITSAFALDNVQLAGLVTDLEKRFKRRINPHLSIDKELIGGVRIAVHDEVIDGSVRGKLAAMAAGLLKA